MKEQAQVEINHKTGSTFYKIGERDDLNLSFRLWLDTQFGSAVTIFGFRVRVSLKDSAEAVPMDYENYVSSLVPTVEWTGRSGKHVSIAGGIKLPVSKNNAPAILERLKSEDMPKKMWDHLQEHFSAFNFIFNEQQFAELFMEIAEDEVGVIKADEPQTAVVLNFAEHQKKYLAGQLVEGNDTIN